LALVWIALSVGGLALAAPVETETAREHALKAQRLFDLGKYDGAIEEYQAAYNLKAVPSLLFNIGQCHRLAGHLDLAVVYYKDYLARTPKGGAKRDEIEEEIGKLEAEIAAQKEKERQEALAKVQPKIEPPPKVEPPPSHALRKAGIGLLAAGVLVAGGGGLGLGFAAASQGNALTDESNKHGTFDSSVESNGRLFQDLSWASYAVGGAMALAGIVLIVIDARHGHKLQASGAPAIHF
jgi:tetratricopeptide (TPR) repeat protein